MFIIDTNMLVSEMLTKYEQDELTMQYKKFFQTIPLIQLVLSDFILNEFEIYMTRVVPSRYRKHMDEKEIKEIQQVTSAYLEKLIEDCTLTSPSPTTIKHAFALYKRFEKNHYISLTDSLLLAVAKDNGYTLLTKDQRLIARAKESAINTYEP